MFLSHTSDLREHPVERSFVAAAENAVMRPGHAVVDMEYFIARDCELAAACARMVASADVYVGIIGHRYGTCVRDCPELSHTELEFEVATVLGLPPLIFLIRDQVLGLPPTGQSMEHAARQCAFRRRLQEARVTAAWIDSPSDLQVGLHHALVELTAERWVAGCREQETFATDESRLRLAGRAIRTSDCR